MTMLPELSQRRRALLVQGLEHRWPGCGAHTKRNQITKREDVVWSELLAPQVHADIRSYVAGWEAGMDAAIRLVADAAPFGDVPIPANSKPRAGQRDPIPSRQRQEVARAKLESLFSGAEGEAA